MIVQARKQYKVTSEESVPMKTRDGITLYADVVRPDSDERFPVLLNLLACNDPKMVVRLQAASVRKGVNL